MIESKNGTFLTEVDEDFEIILICAVRYALGRRTYMPSLVMDYIRTKIEYISDRSLLVIHRDINERKDEELGDPCDCLEWREFEATLLQEINRRRENADKSI